MTRLAHLPLTVDRLREDHLPVTLEWRNYSRDWFLDTQVIGWDDHLAWFRDLNASTDWMFIVEANAVPVAQFGLYDITDTTVTFGRLLVAPTRRGEGFGRFAVEQAIHLAAGRQRLHLEVKTDNRPAVTLYQSVGFAVMSVRDGLMCMEKTL